MLITYGLGHFSLINRVQHNFILMATEVPDVIHNDVFMTIFGIIFGFDFGIFL